VELTFRHTAADGWTLESAGPASAESRTVRQPQNMQDGDDSDEQASGEQFRARFSGESRATVRFFGNADHSSRFRGGSDSQSRFRGSSGAKSRFRIDTSGSAVGSCDPTALCDFAESVCRAYPRAAGTEWAESCASSDIRKCRTEMRRAVESGGNSLLICLFSIVAQCAQQGIDAAGTVSSEAQLDRAVQRGLETCSLPNGLEFGDGEGGDQ